ncbi:PREDICTED: uncharacterized protein At4g04775-like [Camelina sativa]|uniref:Uncharacterized protein At4g04775-like n=1 Tax=Camelina sativa TaxID=90675 RepID=A0ABM0T5X7_CAMSA|nr:PREDICTED: uncharacterized protein At4g04775-like [Camelina sativa]
MSQLSSAGSSGLSLERSSQGGVSSRCWCGGEVTTYTSKTDENPYRRFFRCVGGVKEKNEKHMFRWVDDPLLEEIMMVERKQNQLLEDQKKMVTNNVELQKEMVKEVVEKVEKNMIEIMRQELMVAKESMQKSIKKRICVVIVVAVSMAWLYGKMI